MRALKNTYHEYRKKVVKSKKSANGTEDIYIPKLAWYEEANAFLWPYVTIRDITDNLVIIIFL